MRGQRVIVTWALGGRGIRAPAARGRKGDITQPEHGTGGSLRGGREFDVWGGRHGCLRGADVFSFWCRVRPRPG
jgi:hypothetical protein